MIGSEVSVTMTQFNPQPAWISASTAETDTRVRAFMKTVYGWMFGGLLLTSLAAMWVVNSDAMKQLIFGNRFMVWVLFGAEMILVFSITAGLRRISPAAAASMFLVYSLLNGLSLSVIFFLYTQGSIVNAFLTAAGMFGAMSVYGMVTKRDLSGIGAFMFMGLIGIILASVLNFFLHSAALDFGISIVGVIIFVGLTAWDTQKLKSFATAGGGMQENVAIVGALALYLDFINLFLFLLRLFGNRRR
jgi:FtsH-binding integral membrane protein